jgi:hypothetical protein
MAHDRNLSDAVAVQFSGRRPWVKWVVWSIAVLAMVFLAIFALLERVARQPSPAHAELTAAEIAAEDAMLARAGLVVRDGHFLPEGPFAAPWTTHSLLMPLSWWGEPKIKSLLGSQSVRADLLLADLDVLEPVMERAYGGWDSAARRGWNWEQWFANWRNRLGERGSQEISFDEAFAPFDALIAFQRDNHTQIPLSRRSTSDGSQTALLSAVPSAPCDEIRAGGRIFSILANDAGQRVRAAKQWNVGEYSFTESHYLSMPSSYGLPEAARCGTSWIDLNPVGTPKAKGIAWWFDFQSQTSKADEHPRFERLANGVVYVRLPTFASSNYESVSEREWLKPQAGDRVLIVDLRGNDGGDAGYGLHVLSVWIDESRMRSWDEFGNSLVSSCLYAPLRWNQAMETNRAILASQKVFLQGLLDRMAQPYAPGCPRTVVTEPSQWTYLQHRFNPQPQSMRIMAVVDSGCGSDCELITAELASLPETIVVGANTFGVGQFIQPGYSVLPHTQLKYRLALGRSNFYGDDRSFDGYGLDVDIVLPHVDGLGPEQLRQLAELVARL